MFRNKTRRLKWLDERKAEKVQLFTSRVTHMSEKDIESLFVDITENDPRGKVLENLNRR